MGGVALRPAVMSTRRCGASESAMRAYINQQPASRGLDYAVVLPSIVLLLFCLAWSSPALGKRVLSFDDLPGGVVLTKQVPGLTVSGVNQHEDAPDAALVYDFTAYPELAYGGQQFDGGWDGGNLAGFNTQGKGLVVAGPDPTKMLERRRPSGDLVFEFDEAITAFGFTIIDVEGPEEFVTDTGYFVEFSHRGNTLQQIDFADFVSAGSPYYDPSLEFGNHTANRIQMISAEQVGSWAFDKVTVAFGGSSVLGEVNYEAVPTPTAVLGGLSMLALMMLGRKRE